MNRAIDDPEEERMSKHFRCANCGHEADIVVHQGVWAVYRGKCSKPGRPFAEHAYGVVNQ